MAQVCQVTGKRPMSGQNVSHAHNTTKRKFGVNLKKHKFWSEKQQKFVTLKVSAQGMRTIDKKGVDTVLDNLK
jgi:large subunit ribosomal protein L28